MASNSAAAGAQTLTGKRSFYLYISLACALTAWVGFAPTYFFRGLSDLPPLSLRAHIHGAAFTAWTLLLIVQAALVRADRRDLHRRLGVIGAMLALVMLWAGVAAAIGVAERFQSTGFRPHGLSPAAFLATQLGMLLQFAVLVSLAIWFRRRPETHKRLMLLATISILPPAVARLHLENYGFTWAFTSTSIAYVLVAIAVAYDLWKVRRVHPAYLWGGLCMIGWMFARYAIGKTDTWQAIGQRLIG